MNNTGHENLPRVLGITMVKNERSIIEAFVRHNIRFLEKLVVLDNGSIDGTGEILAELAVEFPALMVVQDERFGYTQSDIMTAMLHQYQAAVRADFVIAIDADEFLDVADDASFSAALSQIPASGFGLVPWCTYVVTPDFDPASEPDPLKAMHWRRRQEAPQYFKVVIRLDGASATDLSLVQGNHMIQSRTAREIPGVVIRGLRMLHYPVRSREQIVAKTVVGWMAYLAVNPQAGESKLGDQWRTNFRRIVSGDRLDHQALCEMSLLYSQTPRKIDWTSDVIYEPSRLVYERRYSTGLMLDTVELLALSWEQSITNSRRLAPTAKIAALIGEEKPLAESAEAVASVLPAAEVVPSPIAAVEELLAEGKIDEALELLSQSLAKQETAELWNDWATIQCARGQHDLAEQGYRRALYLEASHRSSAVNLGIFLMSRGRVQEGSSFIQQFASTLTKDEQDTVAALSASFAGTEQAQQVAAPQIAFAPQKKRFLVVVRAGDNSLHPQWLQGSEARNWDMIVHSFGNECPWQNEEGVEIIRASGAEIQGPKLRAIHALYERKKDHFLSYEYVFFPDDDLAADIETFNRIFLLADHFGLHYAQPALTHDSFMGAWGITMENRSFLLRYTNFVEVMAPVFSRAYLQLCAPSFIENISGYGLDLLWSSWVPSPWKIGILDACPVKHTRPFRVGKLYETLKELGSNPDQELVDLIRKWKLVKEEEQIAGRVVIPTAKITGGILRNQTKVTVQDGQGMLLLQSLLNGFPEEITRDHEQAIGLLLPVIQGTMDCWSNYRLVQPTS
ncbi:glycosyltransferase family 2 protein [Granulicella aggregans]|uniref:glycosyltransferase family 2 protein n=1 Tax=Granulicella aggregans TaxID=474949 RepID=UPI0021DF6635|nr:glycosyltransferase family 2 protein [Granulicella aggregans]